MPLVTRRAVLGGIAASAFARPMIARAAVPQESDPRELHLYNANTGETFRDAYHNGEGYLARAWERLNWFLRDHHVDVASEMDPGLFDMLWRLQNRYREAYDADIVINVHSGYRTQETNDSLRAEGAAPNSFHLHGKAVDLSVQGYGIQFLAEQVKEIDAGGIGTYWRSQFVHIDTGPSRRWFQSVTGGPRVIRGRPMACQKSPCTGT